MSLQNKILISFTIFIFSGFAHASPYFPAQGNMKVGSCSGLALQENEGVEFLASGHSGIIINSKTAGTLRAENNGTPAFGSNGGFFGWLRDEPTLVNGELRYLFFLTIRGFKAPEGAIAQSGEKVVVLQAGQREENTIHLSGSTQRADGTFKTFDCTLINPNL